MPVRKSMEENYSIKGSLNEILEKCKAALNKGGFTNISVHEYINQLTGDFKKLTIYGEIIITFLPHGENIKVNVKSIANVDNVYALFVNPNVRRHP